MGLMADQIVVGVDVSTEGVVTDDGRDTRIGSLG
jgi:hypothetical protein